MNPALTRNGRSSAITALAMVVALVASPALAQTHVVPPKNKYKVEQDVQLGQEAAQQARQQLPIMHDDLVSTYTEDLGRRLVRAIPPEYQHPEFNYSFTPVNVREINAFALPGGPMFVNRGMIEAADNEGEVVGVMAHELSHVLLRHGTAQATKAQPFQIGAIAGAIAGAIIGGNVGAVVSQGSQFGLGTYFLKYSREYERQADILGAQLMARAGYDPVDLARMFQTIEKQGGGRAPEWLSSHPDPGNRERYIEQEAAQLRVTNPIGRSPEFDRVKAHLRQLAPAPTTEEVSRRAGTRGGDPGNVGPINGNVEPPSSRFRTVQGGQVFQASVPSNWREISSNNSVKFVPNGGYGRAPNGQVVFTHGVEFGLVRNEYRDLRQATDALIENVGRNNPALRVEGGYQDWTMSGRRALAVSLSNASEVNNEEEAITISTTLLSDGTLFYFLSVAPAQDFNNYRGVFDRIVRSIRLNQ